MGECSKADISNLKLNDTDQLLDKVQGVDRNTSEEEFQNFMHRVNQVDKIVKKMTSSDANEQKIGMALADEMLRDNGETQINENDEVKIKLDRTVINKVKPEDSNPERMSQEAFMRSVESDAKTRAENRKARNERAETYKRIGNAAFKESNYEKAITYFSKALEQRKDSSLLWNNRALCYMKLELYEKALDDCEWALKSNKSNIKALLNSAKCHKILGKDEECNRFIELAKENNPNFHKYICEFQENLCSGLEKNIYNQVINDSVD